MLSRACRDRGRHRGRHRVKRLTRCMQLQALDDSSVTLQPQALDESQVTRPFVYDDLGDMLPMHRDEQLRAELIACLALDCNHSPSVFSKAIAYHAECFAFASSPLSAPFLDATRYTFHPMPWEHRRRHERTRQLLGARLGTMYPTLPAELCLVVAAHLVPSCAVSATEAVCLAPDRQAADCCVSTSEPVWASYVSLHGIRYVASLSNQPGPGFRKVFDVATMPRAAAVYLLEDHLGVRQVVFSATNEPSNLPFFSHGKPGPWWRVLAPCPEQLEGKSDVSRPQPHLHLLMLVPVLVPVAPVLWKLSMDLCLTMIRCGDSGCKAEDYRFVRGRL